MIRFKKYFILTGSFFIFNLLISLLYLFTNISYNTVSTIIIIYDLLSFILLGYMLSKSSTKKGIIIGLRTSTITIIILFIFGLIFKCDLKTRTFLYYFIILLCTTFGSILSKNLKR